MLKFAVLVLLIPVALLGHEKTSESDLEALEYFAGEWAGECSGKAGDGVGERTYEFVMDGGYLYARTVMRFKPQEKNPEGEVHEDWSLFSYDGNRDILIAREFNIEGFVTRYVLDSLSSDNKTIVMISEDIESGPPGLSARLTYQIKGDNEFMEIFELSFSNTEFSCWVSSHWERKP
jgi:hypothetical protein